MLSIVKHNVVPFTVMYTVTLNSENMLLLSMLLEDTPADTPVARPQPLSGTYYTRKFSSEDGNRNTVAQRSTAQHLILQQSSRVQHSTAQYSKSVAGLNTQ